MDKDISYYRSISNATGCKNHKDMETNLILKRLRNNFENSLDIDTFIDYFTEDKKRLQIYSQKFTENMGYQESFTSLIDTPVRHGDIFYNPKEKSYWLCTESECKSYLYFSGKLTRCNWILKWQNKNGEIVSRPAIVLSASQYNSGSEKTKMITIGYNQLMIYTILDNETVKLKSDKRMFIDNDLNKPKPYKLTRVDTVTKSFMGKGRICLVFTEDQYNSQTDNIDLMLCDYFVPNSVTKPIEIVYNGNPEIRCGGMSKTFRVQSDNSVEWSLRLLDIQKDFVNLVSDRNTAKVNCLFNKSLIGSAFKLVCTIDGVSSELLVNIVGGV